MRRLNTMAIAFTISRFSSERWRTGELRRSKLAVVLRSLAIVLDELASNLAMLTFDTELNSLKESPNAPASNHLPLVSARKTLGYFRTIPLDKRVFERDEKLRCSRIPLSAGSTSELVVDASAFVSFGP